MRTTAQLKAVFDNLLLEEPKNHFTVGIVDDVTGTSLELGEKIDASPEGLVSCMFYGLGSDGTVGANKNSIKIIGQETDLYAQGYYSYDSKKSGGITVSHLRFGPDPIYASYLINKANFLACHVYSFLEKLDILKNAADGVMKAQKARGANFETGNIISRAKALIPILVPLFISAFRRADELATAMEARCYRGGENRTRMNQLKFTKRDGFAFAMMFVMIAVFILSRLITIPLIFPA